MQSEGRDASSCRGAALRYRAQWDAGRERFRSDGHRGAGKVHKVNFPQGRHQRTHSERRDTQGASLRETRFLRETAFEKNARDLLADDSSGRDFAAILPFCRTAPEKTRRLRKNALPLRADRPPKRPPCPGTKHENKPAALAPQRHSRRRRQKNVRLDGAGKPRL